MFYISYEAYDMIDDCELHTSDHKEAMNLANIFVASFERHGGNIVSWHLVKKG